MLTNNTVSLSAEDSSEPITQTAETVEGQDEAGTVMEEIGEAGEAVSETEETAETQPDEAEPAAESGEKDEKGGSDEEKDR